MWTSCLEKKKNKPSSKYWLKAADLLSEHYIKLSLQTTQEKGDKGTSVLTEEDPSHRSYSASPFIHFPDVSVPPELKLKSAEKKVKRDRDVGGINKLWCWARAARERSSFFSRLEWRVQPPAFDAPWLRQRNLEWCKSALRRAVTSIYCWCHNRPLTDRWWHFIDSSAYWHGPVALVLLFSGFVSCSVFLPVSLSSTPGLYLFN